LRIKIDTILPITIAILLPVSSLFLRSDLALTSNFKFFINWFSAAIFLYVMWYLLLFFSRIQGRFKGMLLVFCIYLLFIFGMSVVFLDFDFKPVRIVRGGFILAIMVVIQYALQAQQDIANLMLEKEQIQTENYKAQLKALHIKIDPHFLFNSLNTLRSMVRQQHVNSEKFIISLSDLYRQTLKYNENTTIQLSEELTVLESYLFLMQNRNEEAIKVQLSVDESLLDFDLPTLALQVVVENCFKHNSMTSKMPLHIGIKNTDDLYIEVSNNIQPKIGETESTGYGLYTLKKRYALLNIQQGVIIEETSDNFKVKLKLIKI